MKEDYKKLFAVAATRTQETLWWRRTRFFHICCSTVGDLSADDKYSGVNRLFNNEAAQKPFRNFWKYELDMQKEGIIFSMIRFDSAITDAVDALKEALQHIKDDMRPIESDMQEQSNQSQSKCGSRQVELFQCKVLETWKISYLWQLETSWTSFCISR